MSQKLKSPSWLLCILMDVLGMVSYFIPIWGEWIDILWAPLASYIFIKFFGGKIGILGSLVEFGEEIFPFSDIFPTFTISKIIVTIINKANKKNA